jgi:ABC-type spermidine/putrescine transport system permease subunit I
MSWIVSRPIDASDEPQLANLLLVPTALVVIYAFHAIIVAIRDRNHDHQSLAPAEDTSLQGDGSLTRLAYSGGYLGMFLRSLRLAGTVAFAGLAIAQLIAMPSHHNLAGILMVVVYVGYHYSLALLLVTDVR